MLLHLYQIFWLQPHLKSAINKKKLITLFIEHQFDTIIVK